MATERPTPVPAPTPAPVTPPSVGERGWLSIEFTGFSPDDNSSSLFRKWKGQLIAKRSDDEVLELPMTVLQSDSPSRVGEDLQRALAALESYLNCKCNCTTRCQAHTTIDAEYATGTGRFVHGHTAV